MNRTRGAKHFLAIAALAFGWILTADRLDGIHPQLSTRVAVAIGMLCVGLIWVRRRRKNAQSAN
jgi:uncharacterized membrane-anchored protein